MRIFAIKLVTSLLVCFPVASCSASSEERALKELAKMQAVDFFDDSAQRALAEAVERGNLDRARTALAQGADVNAVGRDGMTPLFWALAKQNIDGFRFLLEQGSNPNIIVELPPHFQEAQAGAMEMAAQMEDPAYLRTLLEHGGDPNIIVNEQWDIPLIYRAIMSRRLDNVSILLDAGAKINHRDKSNATPLMQAITSRQFEIALLLLRSGADPTLEANTGSSVVDFIRKYGDRGIDTRTNDLTAYHEFVAELRDKGLLD